MHLICLGSCNPQRDAIDRAVSEFRKQNSNAGGALYPVPDELRDQLRTLIHTAHHRIESPGLLESFACDTCNTIRNCGNKEIPPAE